MTRTIRIATLGVAEDYSQSLVPQVIRAIGYEVLWVSVRKAQLIILGPFYNPRARQHWVPRPIRPIHDALNNFLLGASRPLILFQTGENVRHDHFPRDYAISFDLAVSDSKHYRLPYWMEMLNWSHEGITGNTNPRFGRLLSIDRLMQPLGSQFLMKPRKAAIFASHIREPRATLIRTLKEAVEVQGFGAVFDKSIEHHSNSGFAKQDILKEFAFNLCPENSLYPGYYTEKIPEAFMADCLPITWTDNNVAVDFNTSAILNLKPLMGCRLHMIADMLDEESLNFYADQCLLKKQPSTHPLKNFLAEMLSDATS